MHGVIFMKLREFVVGAHGQPAWDKMLELAGQPKMAMYLPSQSYPDAEALALVQAASSLTGQTTDTVLESFGEFIAPSLLQMYRNLVDPSWKTLDLLLNVEDTIHTVVRARNKGAEPPRLRFSRVDASTVALLYDSRRQMVALAIGIIRGVAREYGESIRITIISRTPEATHLEIGLTD